MDCTSISTHTHTELDKKYELKVKEDETKKDKNMVIFMSEPNFFIISDHYEHLIRFHIYIYIYIYICPEEGGSRFHQKPICLFQTKRHGILDTLQPSLLDLQDSKSLLHYMTGFDSNKFCNQTG
jgi:hypothetical protein